MDSKPKFRNYFVLFILMICIYSKTYTQQSSLRAHINLDNDWKFAFGSAADPSKDFNYGVTSIFSKSGKTDGTAIALNYKDSQWRQVNLPHDWAVELPFINSANFDVMAHGYKPVGGLFPETSVGWYRRHLYINRKDSGQRFQIQFDGIYRDATVWINGFYLGNHKSGYTGICYDITDYVNFDQDNVIVVRVDATNYEGWFYEGAGIYRHVWLNKFNNLHIAEDGMFVRTSVAGNRAEVIIETTIENQNNGSGAGTLSGWITDRSGTLVAKAPEVSFVLPANGTKIAKQKLNIELPHLWSLEDPYLYTITSIIKVNGKIIDDSKTRFGVRTISILKDGLFLNGKYVKVKGTNNHQDHAGLGSALPDYLQYYRVRLLKDMGANAYRTSHNAPASELLDACDSLGMLVLDEQRLLNSSPEYMNQFESLIKRDRNHPSVFLWSIGNEEGWIQTTTTGKRIAQSLISRQKELDPTRTCTYAADLGNVYAGVNSVIPVRGFNYREKFVQAYHNDHLNQPVIGTEMGSTVTTRGIYEKDTIHAYVPDQDITAPWWASTAEAWWSLAAERNWWMGGFVWTGFDYRGEPTPYQWPNISSHFGLMDVCGFPKNIYYYYQSWWTDKDVLHVSPHWNWKGKEGQPIDVWVNTNADNVELFLNRKSLGKKEMQRNSHLQWQIAWQPGILEAVAYKKGRKLYTKVETTSEPSEVVVTPYKTTMLADGKDACVINISVIDRQGREVPDASNLISFSVSNNARIIGVGNGDPSSHEPDKVFNNKWQRHLFNGKCQVIIQAGDTPGVIQFAATSEGLYKGNTTIHSIYLPPSVLKVNHLNDNETSEKEIGNVIGADISFLPELEAKNVHFSDSGKEKDAIEIMKDHGFNYIRLRLFNDPASDSGYSPKKGFCDLKHTMIMAERIKKAGLKFLLDFHYSDYWADPQQQNKPGHWRNISFLQMEDSLYRFTKNVLLQLKAQGTLPDMVQMGNEINHGIVWPEGHVGHMDSLALLLTAGIKAIRQVDQSTVIMIHVALGGQNDEARFFLDNIISRGVRFDVIGLSYYPKWHGTLDDLRNNLADLSLHYKKDVIVVEYSHLKREVNDIAFNVPGGRGKGSFIWEPLSTWEKIFDKDGKANELINIYDELAREYLKKK